MTGSWKVLTLAAGLISASAIGCGPGSDHRTATSAPAEAWTAKDAEQAAEEAPAFEAELLDLVNAHRVSRGLNALVESAELTSVARDHSVDMITGKYFAHVSPEGLTAGGRLRAAGVETWTSVGENLADGDGVTSARSVYEAWLASPTHRENLEREDWTHAGVGVAVGEEGRVVTQLFLRP